MTLKTFAAAAMAVFTLAATAIPAAADTLADIKAAGEIKVAIDVSHPPYGMLDSSAKETGSDVETAKLLAEDLGVKLTIVPVSGANRVPYLQTNKADVVISSFSVTEERKKVIDYSRPYGLIPVVIAAPKAESIADPKGLDGKSVAVARGTTADIELTKSVKEAGAGATIVRYEDEATADTAVATGQQKIYAGALSSANALIENNPSLDMTVKYEMAAYPMAIGLRKNEPELKAYLDEWVGDNLQNGKLGGIYKTWFKQDLPAEFVK